MIGNNDYRFSDLTTSNRCGQCATPSNNTYSQNECRAPISFAQNQQTQEPPSREQIEQALQSLGIPKNVIEQGPEAVMQYAQQNGIQLPSPPGQEENQLSSTSGQEGCQLNASC
jgi:hypothetical protein